MSLCEARNKTTSPFSFFIGTMSSRQLNGLPAKSKRKWKMFETEVREIGESNCGRKFLRRIFERERVRTPNYARFEGIKKKIGEPFAAENFTAIIRLLIIRINIRVRRNIIIISVFPRKERHVRILRRVFRNETFILVFVLFNDIYNVQFFFQQFRILRNVILKV